MSSPISAYDSYASIAKTVSDAQSASRKINSGMDKDAFLKLLVVQMQNQDPMSPMQDTEFIAQMAQFSALEQMQQLNENALAERAQSLLHKDVMATAVLGSDGNLQYMQVYGTAESVLNVNGTQYLQIGQYLSPVTSVSAVANDWHYENATTQAASLVGKWGKATMPVENAAEGEASEQTVIGRIASVQFVGARMYAIIDGKQIPVMSLSQVSDTYEDILQTPATPAAELPVEP